MKRREGKRPGQLRLDVRFHPEGGRLRWWVSNRVPSLVAKAARENGYSSSSHYIRSAILTALERDLGIDFAELEAEQPSKASNPIYRNPMQFGSANSVEEVV